MKKILTIIGLLLHIIYYVFAILSLGDYEYSGYGHGTAFAYWVYAMAISILIIIIYIAESIISLINSQRTFNIIKLIVVIALVPLVYYVGGTADTVCSIIWNIYFTVVFILEIISLFIKNNNNDNVNLFEHIIKTRPLIEETEHIRVYKLLHNGENYKIIVTKKRANRHTIIHCTDDCIAWEQAPLLPRLVGRSYGIKTPIYKFKPEKDFYTIFVIKGSPNGVIGLDDGIFSSALKFDKDHINVMTLTRFKKGEF